MWNMLIVYLIGSTFGIVGSDAYNVNRWVGRAIWLVGGLLGWGFAKWSPF